MKVEVGKSGEMSGRRISEVEGVRGNEGIRSRGSKGKCVERN